MVFTVTREAVGPGGLISLADTRLACWMVKSESSRKVLQSHQAAFSGDALFSDAPRRRGASLAAAGDGAGTAPALLKAIMDYTKPGYNLFCSFNIRRSKSNLRKLAVPCGLVSKELSARGLVSRCSWEESVPAPLLPPLGNSPSRFSSLVSCRKISSLLSGVVNRLVTVCLLEDNFLSLYFMCLKNMFLFSSPSFG